MILPLRVRGTVGVTITRAGRAMAPTPRTTASASSRCSSGLSCASPRGTTNATGTAPFTSSGMATTAASLTAGWVISAASISMVPMRCPATFITSSRRPVTHSCPSWSRSAASLAAYAPGKSARYVCT